MAERASGPRTLLDTCITAAAAGLPLPHVPFSCDAVIEPELVRRVVSEYERLYGPFQPAAGAAAAAQPPGAFPAAPAPWRPQAPLLGFQPPAAYQPQGYYRHAAPSHAPGALASAQWSAPPAALMLPAAPVPAHPWAASEPARVQGRWVALCKLATCWQPEALRLALGGFPPARLNRLPLVGRRLLHLELPSPLPGGLAWAAALPRLRCLSLAGASQVAAESLYLLSALPQLRALCLHGLDLGDALGPPLAALTQLSALDLSSTGCGDATLECITYGLRLSAWAASQPPGGAAAGAAVQAYSAYGRTSVARWHLSRTRVTAAGLQHLLALPALELLDARGTGVPRAALLPLERRFGLPQPQAAVLARAALAAAAVGGALFPCCCAAGGVALAPAQARAAGAAAGAAAGRACEDAAAWQARGRGAGAGVVQAPLPVVGVRRRAGRQAGGSGDSLHQERDDGQAAMFRGIVTLLCA